jgi:hypothetical protein
LIAERRYPHRVGQTYRLKYNPRRRWFFPQMRRDEALVFKVYDSEKDGRALRGARWWFSRRHKRVISTRKSIVTRSLSGMCRLFG